MKFNDLFSIERTNEIDFYNGDFMRQRWTDAAIVFANSTCFSDHLMDKIGIKAMFECKVECILVTISKKLKNLNEDWECFDEFKRNMSWGLASIFIYIRRKVDNNDSQFLNIPLILVALEVFQLEISGKDDNDVHPLNIQLILVTLEVFQFEISGNDNNDVHSLNI